MTLSFQLEIEEEKVCRVVGMVRSSEKVVGSVGCWSYRVKGLLKSRDCNEILIHIRVHLNFKNFHLFPSWFPLYRVFL